MPASDPTVQETGLEPVTSASLTARYHCATPACIRRMTGLEPVTQVYRGCFRRARPTLPAELHTPNV